MRISIKDFLDVVTYNRLFHYVDLPEHIGKEINIDIQCDMKTREFPPCYVEVLNNGQCRVWYPYTSWSMELERRKDENYIVELLKKKSTEARSSIRNLDKLNQELILAVTSGDKTKMADILAEIEKESLKNDK